jgi:hypothetical protein
MQVDLFGLDRLPQPLDEHVVAPGAAPVHADLGSGSCARLRCVLTDLCRSMILHTLWAIARSPQLVREV